MNRVKSLSKSGNAKKDQAINSIPPYNKDASSALSLPVSVDSEDVYDQRQEVKVADTGRRVVEKESLSYNPTADYNKQPSHFSSSYSLNGREEKAVVSSSMDRERYEMKNSYGDSTIQKTHSYSQISVDTEEKVQKVSPPRRKVSREEKSEKLGNWMKKDSSGSDLSTTGIKLPNTGNYNTSNTGSRQYEPEPPPDGNINAILEVGFLCSPVLFHYNFLIVRVLFILYAILTAVGRRGLNCCS
jgi:kinesin family protein 2/24